MKNLEDFIRQFCRDAGFSAYGFAPPVLDEKYRIRFASWISGGKHADMVWMDPDVSGRERTDLTIRYPWVKSVLVVVENYFSDYPNRYEDATISKYARGEDYHRILKQKLRQLLSVLKSVEPSIVGKIFVDTGAVLEKAFAVSAGLGWLGKNTTLIVENVGSFCFLGVLLLNREFPFGEVKPSRCGSCDKCLKSCPASAISEPGVLDARKCISYLTVENKGAFSDTEKKHLHGSLYGCDVCQNVCPWNILWAKPSAEARYFNRSEALDRPLSQWEEMTEAEFQDIFKKSPIKRLKYERFRRNVVALRGRSTMTFDFLREIFTFIGKFIVSGRLSDKEKIRRKL